MSYFLKKMKIKQEISELEQQIQHFEAAIKELGNPSAKPSGNQLAQVLQARFERLDNEVERARSLESAKALLDETKQKLESKKNQFKRLSQDVKSGQNRVSLHASRINQLSLRLKSEILSFEAELKNLNPKWRSVYNQPLSNAFSPSVTLPFVSQQYDSIDNSVGYKFCLLDSSDSLPESDPFNSLDRSLQMAR